MHPDRAMTTEEYYENYTIPNFQNVEEATIWAHKKKWVEPLRRQLKHRMHELLDIVKPYAGSLAPGNLKIVSYHMAEWDACRVALEIMEEYKKKNINGAVIYAGSEPILPGKRRLARASK